MSNRKNNYKQTDIEKIFNNLLNDGSSTKTLYLACLLYTSDAADDNVSV